MRRLDAILFAILTPISSSLAGLRVADTGDTTLRNLILGFFCMLPLIVVWRKTTDRVALSFLIAGTSFSLLLMNSLSTTYPWGWDIHQELYLVRGVAGTGHWESSIPSSINGMLSVVVLAPTLSLVLGENSEAILRLAYPTVFALVPVVAFHVFCNSLRPQMAFLCVAMVTGVYGFSNEILQLPRQQIAELFLLIVLLLIIRISSTPRAREAILLVICAWGLIVSHYGLVYLFMLVTIGAIFLGPLVGENKRTRLTLVSLVLLVAGGAYAWYISTAAGAALAGVSWRGYGLIQATFQGLNVAGAPSGTNTATVQLGGLHEIGRAIHVLGLIAIGAGLLRVFLRRTKPPVFASLAAAAWVVILAGIAIPQFANILNFSRLYQICLLFLAPLAAIGVLWLAKRRAAVVFATFVGLFLAFNSGFAYNLAGEPVGHLTEASRAVDFPVFSKTEAATASWLAENGQATIYADEYRSLLLHGQFLPSAVYRLDSVARPAPASQLFVGTYNLLQEKFTAPTASRPAIETTSLLASAIVADSGGAQVWYFA